MVAEREGFESRGLADLRRGASTNHYVASGRCETYPALTPRGGYLERI
jgi:hypothetical protein